MLFFNRRKFWLLLKCVNCLFITREKAKWREGGKAIHVQSLVLPLEDGEAIHVQASFLIKRVERQYMYKASFFLRRVERQYLYWTIPRSSCRGWGGNSCTVPRSSFRGWGGYTCTKPRSSLRWWRSNTCTVPRSSWSGSSWSQRRRNERAPVRSSRPPRRTRSSQACAAADTIPYIDR